jgi:hypothetical protein
VSESCTLVAVAGGAIYEQYAEALMESAREFFQPCGRQEYVVLDGPSGWPDGTLLRYHRLLREKFTSTYLYMVDCDMLCVAPIEAEVLPQDEDGVVLTLHPGYVGKSAEELPFEDRPESASYVPLEKRHHYFAGGFVGGERREFQDLARMVVRRIDEDRVRGITARWNDESGLNAAAVAYRGYKSFLSPAYCHPADSSYYERVVWTEKYQPRILALDKTPEQRALTGR